jgi:PLP dependent protein
MTIHQRIEQIQTTIHDLEVRHHRTVGSVTLLAVSKGKTSRVIEDAYGAGLSDFGENYVQEALTKIQALTYLPLCWHFIGGIQSNKAEAIAKHFSWVHSVSRSTIARQLNRHRPASLPALNVCLQVNIDDESSKSGLHPDDLVTLAREITLLPRLNLRGLMVIPKPIQDKAKHEDAFLRTADLLADLNSKLGLRLDTLSMGMSDDYDAAIQAGSTIIRLGQALFGARV